MAGEDEERSSGIKQTEAAGGWGMDRTCSGRWMSAGGGEEGGRSLGPI